MTSARGPPQVGMSKDEVALASEPYHVGRARARGQLRLALESQDDAAQLRRLKQALNSPVAQYDQKLRAETEKASNHATVVSQRLQAASAPREEWATDPFSLTSTLKPKAATAEQTMPEDAAGEVIDIVDDEETSAAATLIQSQFRGRKDREKVTSMRTAQVEDRGDLGDMLGSDEQEAFNKDPEVADAATKIQASFRGQKARKQMAGAQDA